MIVYTDIQQGTPEWHAVRCGIPTASMFHAILAKGEGKTRKSYLCRLAGEIITGDPADSISNIHTERGKVMEPEARDLYAFMKDADPVQVGFIRNGQKGCSPDSLIGESGMLEIKTKLPALMVEALIRDDFPPEHKAQCQGALWVAEREWIDICVYWPKMPPLIKRAYRDEAYIAEMSAAVDAFNDELNTIVERIRSYGSVTREAA
ncbi:lambda exonuclease family protein [Chelatococcus sp. YT9]|uniref:lambda exonuclease family protein n=1 Tax=Chelatococcus sp. YT9 TaxID=2835635 RepID=UPI001BCFB446|nr:lambda exonuclease family protein [Chelatococcus sp. YT9]MBS7698574.1 YqaJ viral recombinase family protein [Chelatococcus sp. YT9]